MNKNKTITKKQIATTSPSLFHTKFRRFSLITLFLFSFLTFKTFPASVQRPEILARNRLKTTTTEAKND